MVRNQIFLIPLVVACTSLLAHAAPRSSSPPSGSMPKASSGAYGSHLEPILKSVKATPEQRTKITEILNEFRPKIEPTLVKYKEKQTQFLSALTSGKSDEDIMMKEDELGQLFSHISNEYCVLHLKVRRCLRPEQLEEYEAYRRKQGWVK